MKKIIFISIVVSLVATAAQSQVIVIPEQDPPGDWPGGGPGNPGVTNQYPNTTGTISKSGYNYKYRNLKISGIVLDKSIELYNATNSYLDMEWGYKNGTPMSFKKIMGEDNVPDFTDSSQTIAQTLAMVDGCFTAQNKAALEGKSMVVTARFNPSTGKIADVYFSFFRDDPFVNIPVETYRSIELALKQNLTLTVTDEGRKLNYIQLVWEQKF